MNLLSFGDQGYGDELAFGALLTMQLAVVSFGVALLGGVTIALATLERHGVRWALWRLYASAFMSVPSLLVIFLIFYGGGNLLAALLRPFGLAVEVQLTPFGAGVAGLGIVYAAYLAEIVRAAIGNVPRGQFEAAKALRLPKTVTWIRVIAPQATRLALPGLVNLWIVVLKDTALVSLVGLKDVIAQAKMAAGVTREPFLFYIVASVFFIMLNAVTLKASGILDRRVSRGFAPIEARG